MSSSAHQQLILTLTISFTHCKAQSQSKTCTGVPGLMFLNLKPSFTLSVHCIVLIPPRTKLQMTVQTTSFKSGRHEKNKRLWRHPSVSFWGVFNCYCL